MQENRKLGESSDSAAATSSVAPGPATPSRKRKHTSSPSDKPSSKRRPGPSSPIPTPVLLLATPGLLAVPPNHKTSVTAYVISLNALRKCLATGGLAPDLECRAWTALAELALKVVRAGWTQVDRHPWARSLDIEVETAIGKGMLIAQHNPTLAVYKQHLTLLQSRFAQWQQKDNYSRALLKRLSAAVAPTSAMKSLEDLRAPSWLVYTTHLTAIAHALAAMPPDYKIAISTIQDLLTSSEYLNDPPIRLLTHVLRLRVLVDARMWDSVGDSLVLAESALGLSYAEKPQPGPKASEEFLSFDDPFEAAMAVHTLIMGVVYYTHTGRAIHSSPRLSHLHALLDSGALSLFPNGTVDIKLSTGPPLVLKVTHPRVLFHLTYLVSSTSKRDGVGRNPKRKLFAREGLKRCEENLKKEVTLNHWADPLDAEEVDERMVKMKADLLSEVVAVCITRSEFEEAKKTLDELIAHTRNFDLFDAYAARITLHHGHLAHALGDGERAARCYGVVAHMAAEGTYVHASARASHLALRLAAGEGVRRARDPAWEEEVNDAVECCRGMGGTMEAVAKVLEASVAKEILSAKAHLKAALDLASAAQDNYLRALVLSLVSALYLATSEEHARTMLETARQLASGLGAARKPAKDEQGQPLAAPAPAPSQGTPSLGNVPLGLWIGERFLEIYKREGNDKLVARQEATNAQFVAALQALSSKREEIFGRPLL